MRAIAGLLCLSLAATAMAQMPGSGKPWHIVNAFPPGGPSDILSRAIADKIKAATQQTIIVENKAGAGGNLAAAEVAKSAPDGTTILSGIDTTFTVNPAIYRSLPFSPQDFKPLMIMASSGLLVGTHPSVGAKSLKDLVDKARVKDMTFSSGSNGSPGHLAVAILADATGAKVTHVPYKGNSPAVQAVVAGDVQAGMLATPGMLPFVKSGRLHALAVTSRSRSPLAPELPTTAEAGVPALEIEVLYIAMVPAATPEPVMATLRRAFADAMQQPDVQALLQRLDMRYEGLTGDDAAKRLATQGERFGRIIKATGMKVE